MFSSTSGRILLIAGGVAVIAVLLYRPRLLLLPIVVGFAAWSWFKVLLSFPVLIREYLLAATLEKNAAGLAAHAQVAATLWGANTEFRPVARELIGRVVAGYGIGLPKNDDEENDASPAEDPFVAMQRGAAISAVANSQKAAKP